MTDLLAILRTRLGTIVRIASLVVATAVVVATILPSRYASSAVVILDQRKNTIADLTSVLSALPTDPASLQNQIQILMSRDLAAEVITKLKLYDDPEFAGPAQPTVMSVLLTALNPRHWFESSATDAPIDGAVRRDAIIDAFLSHLSADSLGLSTTITVTFQSRDAAKAALIANTVASVYVEDQVNSKLSATEATSAWLTQRIADLARQVQAQEAAALTYKAQNNLDSSPGGTSLIEGQLGGINTQLVQARADLAAKSAIYAQVARSVKSGDLANISQVVASPLIIQLRSQQADLMRQEADLAVRYGERNPKRIAVETQLTDLDKKIGEEVSRIAASLASDVAIARAQVGSLQASLIMTQHQASAMDMTAVRLQALEANAVSTRNLYDSYLARLHAIQDQDGLQYPEARVISRAPVPAAPSSPPRLLIMLASIPAGLLAGLLWALLTERFPRTRAPAHRPPSRPQVRPVAPQQPSPQAAMAQPPLLADVPGALLAGAADHIVDWPASAFSRAIKRLLARLAVPGKTGKGRVVCVAPAEQGVAGSTIAVALARAASQSGLRTILVDGSLKKPVIAHIMGVHPQTGMNDVLKGSAALSRTLARDTRSDVLLLSNLQPILDPARMLAAPRTSELFAHLRTLADFIIIAAPTVVSSPETPFLTKVSDVVVVVADPTAGPRSLLGRALQALVAWRSPPVGMVLAR
ncbi:MAG TPA: exopolysaccharide transport family protein [Rhizomicrobium sp.]|nr:exopolysaccharide transport family protein [Rhizomicrobium sp.]